MIDMKVISGKNYEEMKKNNEVIIFFGFQTSRFGRCLIGLLGERWPGCVLINNEKLTANVAKDIFGGDAKLIKVLLKGTDFQKKVWQELLKIPKGETVSYEDIARATGHVKAVRAAANAVAKNAVAYLVPCHRVIRKDGNIHMYQWGSDIKRQILQFEKYNG